MTFSTLQSIVALATVYVAIRVLKRVLGANPLDNLPGPPGRGFLEGHFPEVFNPEGWNYHAKLASTCTAWSLLLGRLAQMLTLPFMYNLPTHLRPHSDADLDLDLEDGGVIKLQGPLGSRGLYVYDPKALHHIIVKDQNIFEETDGFVIGFGMIFGKGLFATTGADHRRQRKMLNPVFSTANMRDLIPIFYDVTQNLRDSFKKKVSDGPLEVEIVGWMGRTALELIGQSGLGYSFDDLTEGSEDNPYVREVKRYNEIDIQLMFARHFILPLVHNIGTPAFRRWAIGVMGWKALQEMRDVVDLLHDTAVAVVESKKSAIVEGNRAAERNIGKGKDLISTLLKANANAGETDRLTDDELVGQVTTLVFAAMDTTSNALSRTLDLLSKNVAVQDKLRAEIREAYKKSDGDRLTYDDLVSLPYLDAVCRETLRLHPPVPTVVRDTRQDVILPFSKPVRGNDGSELHEVLVPKGTKIFPSIISSNRNPEVWGDDACEWKPERWIDGLPNTVADAKIPGVYSHLMTFIGGSRSCIGFKFSQLEMKVVLCTLLNEFKFRPAKEKKVEWKMTGVVTPSVPGMPGPKLFLDIALAD